MLVDADSESALWLALTALVLLYLTNKLALIHLLQSVHHALSLCDLLGCVLKGSVRISLISASRTSDIEGRHHVLPADMTNHHFKRQSFGIRVFFENLGDLTF